MLVMGYTQVDRGFSFLFYLSYISTVALLTVFLLSELNVFYVGEDFFVDVYSNFFKK